MSTPENSYMPCPVWECDYQEWGSPEDPVTLFSRLWGHVRTHVGQLQAESRAWGYTRVDPLTDLANLMDKDVVKLMDEDGNEVKL